MGPLGVFDTLGSFHSQSELRMNPEEITQLIENGIPGATVRVRSGDNTHFEAVIVSDAFAGKRPIARHQLVYGCLGSRMGNEIHALSIHAFTPDEWHERQSGDPS